MCNEVLEICCAALWAKDYPNGGSIYKRYEDTPFHDKELYRQDIKDAVEQHG